MTPEVSRSRRCTTPGRGAPPAGANLPLVWWSKPCTTESSSEPCTGWVSNPLGLLIAIIWASSKITSKLIFTAVAVGSSGAGSATVRLSKGFKTVRRSIATPSRVINPKSRAFCTRERLMPLSKPDRILSALAGEASALTLTLWISCSAVGWVGARLTPLREVFFSSRAGRRTFGEAFRVWGLCLIEPGDGLLAGLNLGGISVFFPKGSRDSIFVMI